MKFSARWARAGWESLSRDPDHYARFQREAQALAAPNHPNIAAIYGLEENALIMEFGDGETLRTPLPVETALLYARQIAEALEYAHNRNIIHRDLKPANVMITREGVVKVLDFELAKVVSTAEPQPSSPNSPTLTMRATEVGPIVGTASYMSPERASGVTVDKRADIWSIGVVLCAMLCGGMLFQGHTVSHTLADVIKGDIDLWKIPAGALRDLAGRCPDRDVKTRLRDIGAARVAPATSGGIYVPSRNNPGAGYLLFLQQSSLLARPFEPARLTFTGEAFQIADQADSGAGIPNISASHTGAPNRG